MKMTAKPKDERMIIDKEVDTLYVDVGVGKFGINETVGGHLLITFMGEDGKRKTIFRETARGLVVGGK